MTDEFKDFEDARKKVKREYFEKVRSQEFWDAVVHEDGPEGLYYAQQALACIQNALGERSSAEWRRICAEHDHKIEQILGKALGYPPLYPDASKVDDGTVCVGEHVSDTLVAEMTVRYAEACYERDQYKNMMATMLAPILKPLSDGLLAFVKMFNEHGEELLKEAKRLKEEKHGG